jgi:Cyclin, N-terminal domain/Cyclin, C-terminal domain
VVQINATDIQADDGESTQDESPFFFEGKLDLNAKAYKRGPGTIPRPPSWVDSTTHVFLAESGEDCSQDWSSDEVAQSPLIPLQQPPLKGSEHPSCSPQVAGMLNSLYSREQNHSKCITPDFLSQHGPSVSPTLCMDATMRAITASWLVEVALEYGISQDSLHLAISLLDRFLSATKAVPRTQLQLLGVACLLIATKHEDETHPSVANFVCISDNCFTAQDLLSMEARVLSSLDFKVNATTPHTFLGLLCCAAKIANPVIAVLSSYLIDLALLDVSLSSLRPSVVGTAALLLAAFEFNEGRDLSKLQILTPHTIGDLWQCMHKLLHLQQVAYGTKLETSPFLIRKHKYSGPPGMGVGLKVPPKALDVHHYV